LNPKNSISVKITKLLRISFVVSIVTLTIIGCQSASRYTSTNKTGDNTKKEVPTKGKTTTKEESETQEYKFESSNPTRQYLINEAMHYLGTPYCYGGDGGESCFDCSGFVNKVYESVGMMLARVSSDIYLQGTEVDRLNAEPGDLVFFSKDSKINHVGIYLGQSKMIHASTSKGVIIQSIDDNYYRNRLAGFRRLLK